MKSQKHKLPLENMSDEVFYKITVTQNNKEDILYYGYMFYQTVIEDVELLYEEGADAVEMEMITEQEFNEQL